MASIDIPDAFISRSWDMDSAENSSTKSVDLMMNRFLFFVTYAP